MIESLKNNKVIAIVGPTASGKTAYSLDLASKIGGEIVSADSRLVYKDFDIATAKPSDSERKSIPHHMIDIVAPDYDYSAGLYAVDARKCVLDILSRGKVPIVVGGTGLYINILLMNYDLPKVEPDFDLRDKLKNSENLYEILLELDSQTAMSIDKNDRKKLIRAIEIVKTAGKPMSMLRGMGKQEFDVQWIGLNHPRDVLYERINSRVDSMVNLGILDETKFLIKKYGRVNNILFTIGYQEMVAYLDGILTFDEAVDKLKQNTRRFAKRQLTWFRKNSNINWDVYPEKLKK